MSATTISHFRLIIHRACCVSVTVAFLVAVPYGKGQQSQGSESANVSSNDLSVAIDRAKQDDADSMFYVEKLGHAGATQATPVLEDKFSRTKDPDDAAKIAQVLVRLGDKKDAYWNFLVKRATEAIQSDAPDFLNYDAQGKSEPGPSPQFASWAAAHNVSANGSADAQQAVYDFPGRVLLLGATGDPRAIPLLREGLSSPNHLIETAAALALAEVGDKESIPLIVAACQKAPAEAASSIARALVYFDDATAQSTADKYMGKARADQLRQARAEGKKTPLSY